MKKTKVLSILPHCGGGVGSVVKNWIAEEIRQGIPNEHTIISLEVNKNPIDPLLTVHEDMYNHIDEILEMITKTDIVLIHWWNHPMLFDLIVNNTFPECRIVMWSLASCLFPPYVFSEKLFEYSDKFIFSSRVSYEAKELADLSLKQLKKIDTVWASFDQTRFNNFKKKEHTGFNVGTIIGSADYSKLSPDFAKMCAKVDIPEVTFPIICAKNFYETLKADLIKEGVYDKTVLLTYVPDILPYLEIFDVFGYPLQPFHFGTCEIAIGEAMLAGVVPVVMNNPAEKHIIEHGLTGFIAESEEDYAECIKFLYDDPVNREIMSNNASESARYKYNVENTIFKWNTVFEEMMSYPKRKREWPLLNNFTNPVTGAIVFAEALGKYGELFYQSLSSFEDAISYFKSLASIEKLFYSNPQWLSENKGGIKQYFKFFKDDPNIRMWRATIND